MAESFLAKIVPPVSTPFGHPVPNEHYYTQDVEMEPASDGSQGKVTPMSYLNQYVEDITAQRLSQAQMQSQQQQRTPSQPSVNAHGLPVRGMPQGVQIGPRPVNHSTPRSAGSQSARPQSAQQILEGLHQMSHTQPKRRAETMLPQPAVTSVKPRVSNTVPVQPMEVDDPFVMDSSPSKGRSSSQVMKPSRGLGDAVSERKPIHLAPAPANRTTPIVTQKPRAQPAKDGVRSPKASDGEDEGDSEDADGEPEEEEDGDLYTPGNERGRMVVDSGRPDKVTKAVPASIRSSARPGSTKIGEKTRFCIAD